VLIMMYSKFGWNANKGTGGLPSIIQMIFVFNGALLHEVFWNILVYKNMIDNDFDKYFAAI